MRTKLMALHRYLIQKGEFKVAKRIWMFLKSGTILLGITDTDFHTKKYLDDLGFKGRVTHDGNYKRYFLAQPGS